MPVKETLAKKIEKEIGKRDKKPDSFKKKGNLIKPEHHFMLSSGMKIKDMHDLAVNLDSMSDDDFFHHVTEDRNDFSRWISDVFKERSLADELLWIKDKKDTQITLLKHLVKKR